VDTSHTIGGQCETNKGNAKEVELVYDGGNENWNFEIIRFRSHLPHHGQ
jgi:hypothetical protein